MPYGEAKLPLAAGEASLRRELGTSPSMTMEMSYAFTTLADWPNSTFFASSSCVPDGTLLISFAFS